MSSIIPTISSGTAGPLGVLHLPRLWQKASLHAVGKLHPDYPAAGQGYDQMTLDALEVDREAFLVFIRSKKPSYAACEKWILDAKGGALDPSVVKKHNESIIGYQHDDATRKEILAASGIVDNGSITDAVNLNNLDDWQGFHQAEIA